MSEKSLSQNQAIAHINRLESRDWELWAMTIVMILVLTLFILVTHFWEMAESPREWFREIESLKLYLIGSTLLVLLFCLYVINKHLELRRLRKEFLIQRTERNKAEEEKRSLEEQLRQAQKMEAVGRLAGGIAHDFNNFLTVMKARSQVALIELKEGDPLKEAFEAIDNATTKSANLVRQLLAFSRRQVMEMIVLNLNTLLEDLEKMLRRLIGEDVALRMVLADDLGNVKADPGQIEQVVLNLVVNARDAMPSGGKLTIETANVELDEAYADSHVGSHPGSYVMLSVSDTGVGMTPEVKEKIFEPFFTTKEKGKGTGLGLSTVYGIVKQSGGYIGVDSEPGQGTTFKTYLPRVEEALTEKEEEEEVPGPSFGVGVILVVEDEEGVRKAVLEVLKKQGYSVLEAGNAEEALLICQHFKETIHLMITDVVMPGMNGSELAKRAVAFHPDMKVLYMSGYTDSDIVHNGVLEKGVNYIQKPFTFKGLAGKVQDVLSGRSPQRRQDERIDEILRVDIGENDIMAQTANISQGGVFIRTQNPLDLEEEFFMKLYIPDEQEPIEVLCKVVWVKQYGKESQDLPQGMGVKFLNLQDEFKRRIKEFIKTQKAEKLLKQNETAPSP